MSVRVTWSIDFEDGDLGVSKECAFSVRAHAAAVTAVDYMNSAVQTAFEVHFREEDRRYLVELQEKDASAGVKVTEKDAGPEVK